MQVWDKVEMKKRCSSAVGLYTTFRGRTNPEIANLIET